jgi:Protein of unknown function (DUF559)/Transcriptional regulator, AbiEi antitoxin
MEPTLSEVGRTTLSEAGRISLRMDKKFGPADRAVAALAARQHGVVAVDQLIALGLGASPIHHRVVTGRLHRIHAGVYAVGHASLTQSGRWMAALLACGEGALLSHRSAAELWGIGTYPDVRIDVTVADRSGRRRPGIAIHRPRSLLQEDRTDAAGIAVTTPARTILDLAGVIGPRRLERSFHEADRLGLLDPGTLASISTRTTGRRGGGRLRALLAAHIGPSPETRSVLEHRFLRLCHRAGLPTPAVNVPVCEYEVDVLWPAQRLVVELDGYAFHHARKAFESDRARDAALQLAGYRVLRVTHRRLVDDPSAVIETVRTLLAAGRRA